MANAPGIYAIYGSPEPGMAADESFNRLAGAHFDRNKLSAISGTGHADGVGASHWKFGRLICDPALNLEQPVGLRVNTADDCASNNETLLLEFLGRPALRRKLA